MNIGGLDVLDEIEMDHPLSRHDLVDFNELERQREIRERVDQGRVLLKLRDVFRGFGREGVRGHRVRDPGFGLGQSLETRGRLAPSGPDLLLPFLGVDRLRVEELVQLAQRHRSIHVQHPFDGRLAQVRCRSAGV